MKILLVDNFDSFTYMLKDYIEQCQVTVEVRRNDEDLPGVSLEQYGAIVISPGPGSPAEANQLMPFLRRSIERIPILGVCLGHQAIGAVLGGEVVHAALPRHGKTEMITHHKHPLFTDIPEVFRATRYHSLILDRIRDPLEIIAQSERNEIMAIAHKTLPVCGVQFHPESCQTEYGRQLIENFLKMAGMKY